MFAEIQIFLNLSGFASGHAETGFEIHTSNTANSKIKFSVETAHEYRSHQQTDVVFALLVCLHNLCITP